MAVDQSATRSVIVMYYCSVTCNPTGLLIGLALKRKSTECQYFNRSSIIIVACLKAKWIFVSEIRK